LPHWFCHLLLLLRRFHCQLIEGRQRRRHC